MGNEARGKQLADYVERNVADLRAKVAEIPQERRPRVYYARSPSGLQTALSGSINVEVLDVLGAINVAGNQSTTSGLANVSMEQVLAWNPEVIVTTDPGFFARCLERRALVGRFRRQEWPGVPLAAAAVRLVRLPAGAEPHRRTVLARATSFTLTFSRTICASGCQSFTSSSTIGSRPLPN